MTLRSASGTALGELYACFASTEPMTANVLRDSPSQPRSGADSTVACSTGTQLQRARVRLGGCRGARRARLRAVIGHAIDFDTWRSLVRERRGWTDGDAAEFMVRLARAV